MGAGRFGLVEQPTALAPTFGIVDTAQRTPLVLGTIHNQDQARCIVAMLNDAEKLPPSFDLPGDPTDEPW